MFRMMDGCGETVGHLPETVREENFKVVSSHSVAYK